MHAEEPPCDPPRPAPPHTQLSPPDARPLVTCVRQQDDCEVFELERPDVDFEQENERRVRAEVAAGRRDDEICEGREIISAEVSTTEAYLFFQKLEASGKFYTPPQAQESGGTQKETAKTQMSRLEREIDELARELRGLESQLLPSPYHVASQSCGRQLAQATELSAWVTKVCQST